MAGGNRTSLANVNPTFPGIIGNEESMGRERREWRTRLGDRRRLRPHELGLDLVARLQR
jgi:hypothetical protein